MKNKQDMKKLLLWIVLFCQTFGFFIYYIILRPNITLDFTGKYSKTSSFDMIRDFSAYAVKPNGVFPHQVDGSKIDISSVDSSLKFIYSEAAIRQYANAINMAARKYVDIGSGACAQRLPQCIIIGNFKCGTRELIDYMSIHPRIKILFKPYYEIDFFNKLYSRGLEWYRRSMPCSNEKQITVVKAPSYFQSDTAPSRIHEMNSSIKLIAMFREPVSRTMSHFTFNKYGARYRYDLTAAVRDRNGAINEKSTFIRHSIYDEGLARYLKYFNKNQLKIIDITDFQRDPYKVLHEVEGFLNIEHTILRNNFVFNKKKGFYCLRKELMDKTAACYQTDRGRNVSKSNKIIKTSPELIAKLKAFFKPHNENFFRLAGRVFDWKQHD